MSDQIHELSQALASLTRYFVGSETLGETLNQVCELTIQAVPPAHHVGITLMVDGKLSTSVFTHPEVPEIDRAQYRTGEGPCIDAFRTGVPYMIRSTLERGRWQEFRDSAAEHRVLSTLSLPLLIHDDVAIGAINMYAETEAAFTDDDQRVAELFASHAAFVLANAQAYWDARLLSENLEQAMVSRAVIEQAKGILMSTTGEDEDGAMRLLIQQSQHQNIKVRELAADIVRDTRRQS